MAAAVVLRIKCAPIQGKIVVPRELKACVRLKRLEAVCGLPNTATYGFAATWRMVMPVARMINAARKNGNEGILAAGKKARHATTMVSSPATMALLYPIQSMIFDAGMEKTKYAEKKAVWISMLAASSILKTCCTYGIRTSFKEVSEPHMKKSVVRTASAPVKVAEVSLLAAGL